MAKEDDSSKVLEASMKCQLSFAVLCIQIFTVHRGAYHLSLALTLSMMTPLGTVSSIHGRTGHSCEPRGGLEAIPRCCRHGVPSTSAGHTNTV